MTYYDAPYRHLLAGLGFQDPDPVAMVSAAEEVVEQLVVPAMFVELDWRTTAITPADDLERGGGKLSSPRRDWDRLRRRGRELESGSIEGCRRDVPATLPPDPSADPVHVLVRGLPGRAGTLTWSVQEWTVRDLGEYAAATQRLLLTLADRLGADGGFITLDVVAARVDDSPWELAVGQPRSRRDFRHQAWGYGWGTLLGPGQVALLGEDSLARLPEALPTAVVSRRADGAAWIRLGATPVEVTRDQVRQVREFLQPVLPAGTRPVDQDVLPPGQPLPPYMV